MREIKFRAWDKEDKKMYVVAHISNLLTVGTYVTVRKNEPDAITKIERDLEEDTYELMQYTGLKDKNGKEIYEGDIVRVNLKYTEGSSYNDTDESFDLDCFGVVKFNPRMGYKSKVFRTYDNDMCEQASENLEKSSVNLASYRTEVIGNIYENPELLNEGSKE